MWGGSCDENWAPVLELASSASICIIRHCAAAGKGPQGITAPAFPAVLPTQMGVVSSGAADLGQHRGICSECCSSDLGLCIFLVSAISCTCHCPPPHIPHVSLPAISCTCHYPLYHVHVTARYIPYMSLPATSCTCHYPLYPARVTARYILHGSLPHIYISPAHACGCGGK